MTRWLATRIGQWRFGLLAVVDTTIWWVALATAMLARVDFALAAANWERVMAAAAVASVVNLACGLLNRLYLGSRRLASFEEVRSTAACTLVTTASLLVIFGYGLGPRLPRSVLLAAGAYELIGSLGFRYVVRALLDARGISRHPRSRRLLIFGGGTAGYQATKALLEDPKTDLLPVAFLDDDPLKARLRLLGLPVFGDRSRIAAAASHFRADTLLIAMPSAQQDETVAVADAAQAAGLDVRILPRISRFIEDGDVRSTDIREITLADFLERDEINLDLAQIAGYLEDKKVLVTGAGGSIGAQLCEAVLAFSPQRLLMLDHDENALHALQMRLFGRADGSSPDVILADIREGDTVRNLMREHSPHVVFHAAAHKHVPYLELHPAEGVKTNILGTLNVLRASVDSGVERFVNVSTDKAAAPANVLGMTKRIAEMLTAHVATASPGAFMSVRFGNVLGSNGSVIPILQDQLRRGVPLTITHPEVTRYFMTIEEAVRLVVQAGAVGGDGDVMVLEMGQPVRIVELARRLSAIMRPGVEPEFEFIGLRPGEKLHESLLSPEDRLVDRPHEMLMRCRVPELDPALVGNMDFGEDPVLLCQRLLQHGTPARTEPEAVYDGTAAR